MSAQNIHFQGGGWSRCMWKNILIPIDFQHFMLISIIFMAAFGIENLLVIISLSLSIWLK